MSRTQKTKLLAIVSGINLLVSTISSVIMGRLVLVYLGSEYNGINAIVSQFLLVITIVEGGFTTASLVALMKPYAQKDLAQVNQLFAETKVKFYRISTAALIVGIISVVIYGFFVETTISYVVVVLVMAIGLICSVLNMGVLIKYRLIFQAAQEEHIYSIGILCTTILAQIIMGIVLVTTKNIVLMRSMQIASTMLSIFIINRVFAKRYPMIKNIKWDGIKRVFGTKDLLVGKIVGTIHSSFTVVFLSIFGGAAITSVYSVYNAVIHAIVSVVNIFITAPQNALGQVLQSEGEITKKKIVLDYEYIVTIVLTILFIPLGSLIVPFVKLYTAGVTDIEYINYLMAFLMIAATYIQLIHIPAGVCIYMSGCFLFEKRIQEVSVVILVLGNLILGKIWGLYGFLVTLLLCNIFLAIAEIYYVHTKIVKGIMMKLIMRWIPNTVLMVLLLVLFNYYTVFLIDSIFAWIVGGIIITGVGIILTIVLNIVIFKKDFCTIIKRLTGTFLKKNRNTL